MSTGQWQDVRDGYLRQIEKQLSQVDPEKRAEILGNVREHLEVKYSQLTAEQRSIEHYRQIVSEMGPPQEYAELLDGTQTARRSRFGINALLTVVFVIVLIGVSGYLVYAAKQSRNLISQGHAQDVPAYTFEPDERVVGTWTAIDFVRTIESFKPAKKAWQGDLYLKSLTFEKDGTLIHRNQKTDRYPQRWTKGRVAPDSRRPAFYYLRTIDGKTYMFYEWISGDVTIRGREPLYYVLVRESDAEAAPAWFVNDSQAIGYWKAVDFVQTKEAFVPGRQASDDLFIKTLHFDENGTLRWTVGDSAPIALNWTKGKIRPFDILPASYTIQTVDQSDYLFYEHKPLNDQKGGYYVFRRTDQPAPAERQPEAFVNDPDVLGEWTSVDFVGAVEQFVPGQQQWQGGRLYLNSLLFKDAGDVEMSLTEDEIKAAHRWTAGKVIDDTDQLDSNYTIRRIDGSDYLFMEWNSGDVTLRGYRPAYYVLKRSE
jgi:hypothetical protein